MVTMVLFNKQTLLLLRGLPGAGKTTLSRALINIYDVTDVYEVSADDWRDNFGAGTHADVNRIYNKAWSSIAHAWCLGQTADALARKKRLVIVANVFERIEKIKPYAMLRDNLNAGGYNIALHIATVEGPVGRSIYNGVNYDGYIRDWEKYTGEFDAERIATERTEAAKGWPIEVSGRVPTYIQEQALYHNECPEQYETTRRVLEDPIAIV
jgi:predicted kinase